MGKFTFHSWEFLVKNNSRPFNFSFRLTFSGTATRKPWYQSVTLTNHKLVHPALGFLGQLLAFNLIGFTAGVCWAGTNNQLDQSNLGLGLLTSDCQSFLIITTVLLFLVGLVASSRLATADMNTDRTEVSGYSILILVLTNLCAASILACISMLSMAADVLDQRNLVLELLPSFLHSLSTCAFPGVQVMLLVMSLDIGSTAFCRLVTTDDMLLHDEFHLDLVLLPSVQISCLTTHGSIFTLTDCESILILFAIFGLAYRLTVANVTNRYPSSRISVGLTQM